MSLKLKNFHITKISVSKDKINELILLWQKGKHRKPTQKELDDMIEAYIKNEILYHKALRMKLDMNEPAIKKILVDKIKYVTSEAINPEKISENELKDFFQKHKKDFLKNINRKITFKQIYLNPKKHKDIEKDANDIFKKLLENNQTTDNSKLGDKFYAGNYFEHLDKKELRKYFSMSFLSELYNLPIQQWTKPLRSGFGVHIIYIEKLTKKKELTFDDVKKQVKNRWLIEKNYSDYEHLYKKLRDEYVINIERNNTLVKEK